MTRGDERAGMLWTLAGACAAMVLWCAPASAAETRRVIAELPNVGAIRTFDGLTLFSQLNTDTGKYSMVVFDGSGPGEVQSVAESDVPFDADIGPDSRGRPTVVWSECGAPVDGQRCDLRLLRIGARSSRAISSVNSGLDEVHPTLWRGRVAFVRRRTRNGPPQVFMRRLDAPATSRSTRLRALPDRRPCGKRRDCRASTNDVNEMELHGRLLAFVSDFNVFGGETGGLGALDVRLIDVLSQRSREVTSIVYGEGGQRYGGLSFAAGFLGYARMCNSRECSRNRTVLRYNLATRRCTSPPGRFRLLRGFALLGGGRTLEVAPDQADPDSIGAAPSKLLQTSGARYTAAPCRG